MISAVIRCRYTFLTHPQPLSSPFYTPFKWMLHRCGIHAISFQENGGTPRCDCPRWWRSRATAGARGGFSKRGVWRPDNLAAADTVGRHMEVLREAVPLHSRSLLMSSSAWGWFHGTVVAGPWPARGGAPRGDWEAGTAVSSDAARHTMVDETFLGQAACGRHLGLNCLCHPYPFPVSNRSIGVSSLRFGASQGDVKNQQETRGKTLGGSCL